MSIGFSMSPEALRRGGEPPPVADKKHAIADHLSGLRASRGSWVLRENRRFCTKRRFFCNFSLAVERKVEKTLNNNLYDLPLLPKEG